MVFKGLHDRMVALVQNSSICKALANLLHADLDMLEFAVSKLISVVVPLDFLGDEFVVPLSFAGNVVTYVSPIPAGHRFRLEAIWVNLVTDATAGSRYIHISVVNAVNTVIEDLAVGAAIVASKTGNLTLHYGAYASGAVLGNSGGDVANYAGYGLPIWVS